jgi:phosphoribosylformylglycinamidine cyclo-ligase
MSSPPLTYREAGVDIAAADAFVALVRRFAESTHGPGVLPSGDAYAGLFRPPLAGYKAPLLAATCDGVGSKLLIARACGRYRGLGQDLVAMNVNDLLPRGATPLLFLDYIATGRLDPAPLLEIADGMAAACRESGCALLGGETAEMPEVYRQGEFDLAGFAVGWVDEERVPRGDIAAGDVVLGLPSSGIHSNGLSLARHALLRAGIGYKDGKGELGRAVGEELLIPTRLYVRPVLALLQHVRLKAAAHVTGGGLLGRARKLVPAGLRLLIDPESYVRPPIFDFLGRAGGIEERELAATFNMGLGFLAILAEADAEAVLAAADSEWRRVGRFVAGETGVELGYAHG